MSVAASALPYAIHTRFCLPRFHHPDAAAFLTAERPLSNFLADKRSKARSNGKVRMYLSKLEPALGAIRASALVPRVINKHRDLRCLLASPEGLAVPEGTIALLQAIGAPFDLALPRDMGALGRVLRVFQS